MIPRFLPSYLPLIAADISTYAIQRNMKLNEKKFKEEVISFVKSQSTVVSPMRLNGVVIERVPNYKLLGVIISQGPCTAICLVLS